ncbi:ABC transporter ATP-binding protein [Paenibacillus kobensis]|uniref:ABC transporter ATP-binding protein n=1 Tax=Paenibacillus kobensis TaxID=59841 RepID=UPI000FDCAEF9|nr:ABC transporter ATP-binding protein [Paenibacillus kobensis]
MNELLCVTGLKRTFGARAAVEGIDMSIKEGRCVALLGPNGAGKTTTIRMLTGLLPPTSGTIKFRGEGMEDDFRRHIGYLPQAPVYYGWMSGRELLVHAGRLCGLSAAAAEARAAEMLERVGLSDAARRRVGGYSGGMKQRLGIAQALVHRPRLVIMDEPVSALDPIGRREVLALMRELKEETTVLFSTHVLHDAESVCDDVIIMADGRVAAAGAVEELRSRYRQPIIELRVEEDARSVAWADEMADGRRKLPHVDSAEHRDGSLRFAVDDLDAARIALMQELVREGVKAARLEAGFSTLEDLFLKVVEGRGNLARTRS